MDRNQPNPYAAPKHVSMEPGSPEDCWSDGELLVVTQDSRLPQWCAQCNQPADDQVEITGFFPDESRRTSSRLLLPILLAASVIAGVFCQPLFALIGIDFLVPEIVTIFVLTVLAFVLLMRIRGEKSGLQLHVSLCTRHRTLFVVNRIWARLCACLPFGLIATIAFQKLEIVPVLGIQFFFVLMFLSGTIWFAIAKFAFVPQLEHRIDNHVWLSGCDLEFVQRLAPYSHAGHDESGTKSDERKKRS